MSQTSGVQGKHHILGPGPEIALWTGKFWGPIYKLKDSLPLSPLPISASLTTLPTPAHREAEILSKEGG